MKSIFADIVNRILKDNIHPVFCQYTVMCSFFILQFFFYKKYNLC